MRTLVTGAFAAAAGAVLGIALAAATMLMASAGPAGDGWSFRGNGALVVPIGFGAAVLAGGWMVLFLYARGAPAWLPLGIVIAVAAAVPSLLSIVLLVIFEGAAQGLADGMTLLALLWPALSLAYGVVLELQSAPARRLPHVATLLAILAFTAALIAGLFGADALAAWG